MCSGLTATGTLNTGSTTACGVYDADVLVSGDDGKTGITWDVESGTHFAGIGTVSEAPPAGTEVNMAYEVNLRAGFASYFLFALIGIAGSVFFWD